MFGTDVKKEKRNSLTLGLVLGAAAGAVGVLLTDKSNRKKVSDKMQQARQWSMQTSKDLKDKALQVQDSAEDKAKEAKTRVQKRTNSVKEDVESEKEALKEDVKSLK